MKRRQRPPIALARDIMTRQVVKLSPDQLVEEAVIELVSHGLSGAPVVDEDGRPVGVLSEYDCLRVLAESAFEGWPAGRVRDWMTEEVETVRSDEDVFALAGRMTSSRHRRLFVVEDDKLVGVVARADLVKALAERIEEKRSPTTYELIANPPKGRSRI
jgi:CBS domain-containing protein